MSEGCFAQKKTANLTTFKGEHYAFYTKCFSAITFCEITQQTYTSCGSTKNCYGLYVMPGDTFYVNIEDKNQQEVISADISFGGYLPTVNNFTFQPIDINCIPQQALQIVIPLSAVPGTSFQIVNQNITYVNNSTEQPGLPNPYNIYVGGQQPQFTFALSDFSICPQVAQVSVREIESEKESIFISPNPATAKTQIKIKNFQKPLFYKVMSNQGSILKSGKLDFAENELLLNEIGSGIYSVSFYLEGQLIAVKKLLVID